MSLKNKRGEIRIKREILFDEELIPVLHLIFSKFIPVHLDQAFDEFIYFGMCEEFEIFEEASVKPFPIYDVEVDVEVKLSEDDVLSIKFIRRS